VGAAALAEPPQQWRQHTLDLGRFVLTEDQNMLITNALSTSVPRSAVNNLVLHNCTIPLGDLRKGLCPHIVFHVSASQSL
jgi:hypothetical protein